MVKYGRILRRQAILTWTISGHVMFMHRGVLCVKQRIVSRMCITPCRIKIFQRELWTMYKYATLMCKMLCNCNFTGYFRNPKKGEAYYKFCSTKYSKTRKVCKSCHTYRSTSKANLEILENVL